MALSAAVVGARGWAAVRSKAAMRSTSRRDHPTSASASRGGSRRTGSASTSSASGSTTNSSPRWRLAATIATSLASVARSAASRSGRSGRARGQPLEQRAGARWISRALHRLRSHHRHRHLSSLAADRCRGGRTSTSPAPSGGSAGAYAERVARIRLGLAQLNTVVGDLDGNVERILAAYDELEAAGCDLAVFPELAITGTHPRTWC